MSLASNGNDESLAIKATLDLELLAARRFLGSASCAMLFFGSAFAAMLAEAFLLGLVFSLFVALFPAKGERTR